MAETGYIALILALLIAIYSIFAFAGVLSLNRSFHIEMEESCLEGLMACPISRDVIYIGKMLGSLLFMLLVEALTLPLFALFFNINIVPPPRL